MNDDLTTAVNQTDLPGLISDLYPESKARPGKQDTVFAVWRGNTRTPSFSIHKHPQTGVWFYSDKATGESGNAFDFLTKIFGMEAEEAGRILKEGAGISPDLPAPERKATPPAPKPKPKSFEPKALDETEEAAFLQRAVEKGPHRPKALGRRGFKSKDLDDFMIVADGDDALIPLFSPDGKLLNVKRRLMNPGNGPKYRYEYSGQGSPPWVSENILTATSIIIVEGELNGMIAYSLLREHVDSIGIMGVAGVENRIYHDLLRDRVVYVYADADDPGQKAREKWVEEAWQAEARTVFRLAPLVEGDFCDMAAPSREQFTDTLLRILDRAEVAYSQEDRRIGAHTIHEIRKSAERYTSGTIHMPTGFRDLDSYTGGLPENDIALVAALPGVGKSAFVRQSILAYLDSLSTNKALLFTPDQSPGSVMRLIASYRSQVPLQSMRTGFFPEHAKRRHGGPDEARKAWWEAFDDALLHLSKRLIVSEKQDIDEVVQDVYQHVENGVGLVAFDYIQMFESEQKDGYQGQKEVMKRLKALSTSTLKVTMLMAAQLAKSKFSQGRRSGIPVVSDIEGTGSYHQLANHVYLLYNQSKYMQMMGMDAVQYGAYSEIDTGKARVIVAKNKEGEAGNYKYLRWHPDLVTFTDL